PTRIPALSLHDALPILVRCSLSSARVPEPPSLVVAARAVAGSPVDDRADLAAAQADVLQGAVVQRMEELGGYAAGPPLPIAAPGDRKSTRLNSSHQITS